ncbi:MAG: fibronectin/fibrinogen-binding protein [Clostridiaceae bacterium]|nr:fibronectin/fibrinogen-binding protein [Clostridiaceae bacterium]
MAFDGIVLKNVISELNTCLIGGKINKIYEPNKNEIILGIYSNGKNYGLLCNISSNAYRMHLTTNSKPNPMNAPNFCMLLRKHLIGFKIKSISSPSLERIASIELEGFNELNDLLTKTLVIELMGKHSNIILLNENNIIIDSIRHLDMSSGSLRDILPAREYAFPTSDKKNFISISGNSFIDNIIKEDFIKSISDVYTGFSNTFVNEITKSLNISNKDLNNDNISLIYNKITYILNHLGTNNISCYKISDKDYTISAIPSDTFLQTNFFLDDFYFTKEQNDSILTYKNNLLRLVLIALKKISKKICNINLKLKECEDMDKYRIYGELITSNLYHIDANINKENITLSNYYDNNNSISIPLDSTISISYNAKKFFKKYHKLKNTLEIVSEQKIQAEKELDYLESIVYELENATSISELDEIYAEICENGIFKVNEKSNIKKNKINKRKINDEYEPIIYTVDGFSLYVGKNNKQNDYITTKLGKNEDYWFHTKDIRGSHCLLKCNGKQVKEHTLIACAQIAAFHSKAKLSSNVPVDYCFIKNVKKPSNSKPGMVIYTNNKTLNVNPKQL